MPKIRGLIIANMRGSSATIVLKRKTDGGVMRYLSRVLALSVLFSADVGIFIAVTLRSAALWHASVYIAVAALIALAVEIVRLGA